MKRFFLLLICFVNLSNLSAQKFGGWKQAQTQHFNFIYEENARKFAEEYALYADEAWNSIAKIYGFPQEKTDIFITDRTNTVNAFTYTTPLEIVMFTTPCITPDFGFRENWQKLFFTHELIHVANMKFEDSSNLLSILTGSYLDALFSNDTPNWGIEGLATVLETQLTKGGRGRSPYFELFYKAPTLDNAFIPYQQIGLEEVPPHGQAYVMGYLILQSIVDRWGIEALGDIERNHAASGSWEESVKLVTGCTPADIFKDVKIALSKKYNKERLIPEGLIVTPRSNHCYYFKPAIVYKDGKFITIRKSYDDGVAVVKFTPTAKDGSNWFCDTKPQEDLNTIYKETILFRGDLSSESDITASEDATIYASLANYRNDRSPGYEVSYDLYSFTEEDGLKQITKGTSLFQPSVSRNGKVLVAVEQNNLKMRLVLVDPETGSVTPLIESEDCDYFQPSVNEDGSLVAFLEADGTRAKVCIYNIATQTKQYVANFSGEITDPSYPCWNSDGKLTFANNSRGRLEVFEVNQKNNTFVVTPVVSDPIGATWAYKTDKGIYYASYSSTGNVIKIKPSSEWGKVPDFKGPSKPGEIVNFGNTHTDYPDFIPFENPYEMEITKEENENLKGRLDEVPVPIIGKYIQHRSEEKLKALEKLPEPSVSLSKERIYIPLAKPVLYLPTFSFQNVPESDESKFGFGYSIIALTPRLQMNSGALIANFDYFPGLKNFEGLFGGLVPMGPSTFAFWLNRDFSVEEEMGTKSFVETNSLTLGFTKPIVHRTKHYNETDIEFISSIRGNIDRTNNVSFSINDDVPVTFAVSGQAGVDCTFIKEGKKDSSSLWNFSIIGTGIYNFDFNKFFAGLEGKFRYQAATDFGNYELNIVGRYTDFPYKENNFLTDARIPGTSDNCIYPGKIILKGSYLIPNIITGTTGKVYTAMQTSFGKNHVNYTTPDSGLFLNLTLPSDLFLGGELTLSTGEIELSTGTNIPFNFDTKTFGDWKFYFNCRLDWWKW
ncbi:MAG: hypothetical protein MJ174_03315 [Treponema sp.]|nr:hypothetical protein [Treponema sp.]